MRRTMLKTRMASFALVVCVLWVVKWVLILMGAWPTLSPGLRSVLDFLTLLIVVPVIYYVWKLFAVVRRKLLWKIRRRLILAHIFIGAIPVLLVVLILYVTGLLLYYQLSYYLIDNQIGIHTAQIHAFNLSLRAGLQQALATAPASAEVLRSAFDRDANYLLGSYPSASIVLRVLEPGTDRVVTRGNRNVNESLLKDYQVPRWLADREFNGLIVEDSQPAIYRASDPAFRGSTRGRLYIRSLVVSDFRPEAPFSLEISVPLDRYLLERLKAALGLDLLLADRLASSGLSVILQTTDLLRDNIVSATFETEAVGQVVSRPVWSILLFPVSWNSGVETVKNDSQVLFVELSTAKLIQNVFHAENDVSRTILGVLKGIVFFFLVVEVVSLVIGILLTKSITSAVYSLYRGTEFVRRGDFSHRVIVKSQDQLGALAQSFNQMTEYVQSLVRERVEKERMERELEIAKEVQEQLFPRHAPQMERMELTGICLPARVVSGDYYDFLQFGSGQLAVAIGDICGKGISAALLMANLQAALRSNVLNLARNSSDGREPIYEQESVARVVRMVNEHICSYTSANKFASFFYAVYDDSRTTLTYCNAGHNPPLFFNRQDYRRLQTGGTVVGIFRDAEYEQETIHLESGDVFLAYTDGIVESVNEYGEEFGEQRLVELVQSKRGVSAEEIQKYVVERVLDWAFEAERDDDMTLVVARFR